jgi:hypothetical protein
MSVQFKSNKVLFRGGNVSFCAADCTCPDDTPTDPPVIPNTCTTCKSPTPCAHYVGRKCTPRRLKLTLTEPTYQTACFTCDDSSTIKKVSGGIAGDYTLEQDPYQACRWVFTDSSPTLVVTGFTSGDCTTGGTTATRLDVSLAQTADGFAVQVIARFNSLKDSEFIVFSATSPGLLDFVNANVLAGDVGFPIECRDYQERGGGRLATGGTATVTICPDVPKICHCTDSPSCLTVGPLVIPPGVPDFTYDELATATTIAALRTNVCEWRSATVAAAGVSNIQVKVKWYDAADVHAVQGCGYYLYVYAFDGVDIIDKAIYYHYGEDAGGVYELFEDFDSPGMIFATTVTLTCGDSIGPTDPTPPGGTVYTPNCSGRVPRTRVIGFNMVENDIDKHMGECGYGSVVMGDGEKPDQYTLTQDPTTPSQWVYEGVGPGLFIDGVHHNLIRIVLTATGSGHTLTVAVLGTGGVTDPLLFQEDGSNAVTSCCAELTFINFNTSYDCSAVGINGTAYLPPACPE